MFMNAPISGVAARAFGGRRGARRPTAAEAASLGRVAWVPALLLLAGCAHADSIEETLVVTATAYNSLEGQTTGNPSRAAWGDRLEPGIKAIAVSRDLIGLGLDRNAIVRIEGLEGEYLVLDKMHSRWRHRIDIFMGKDVSAAKRWGRRKVRIWWTPEE